MSSNSTGNNRKSKEPTANSAQAPPAAQPNYYREPPRYFGIGSCACGSGNNNEGANTNSTNGQQQQYSQMLPKQPMHRQTIVNESVTESQIASPMNNSKDTDILDGTNEKEDIKAHLRHYDFQAAHPFSSRNSLSALKHSQHHSNHHLESHVFASPTNAFSTTGAAATIRRQNSSTSTPQIPRVFNQQDAKQSNIGNNSSQLLRKSSLTPQSSKPKLDSSILTGAIAATAQNMTSSNEIASSSGRIETWRPGEHNINVLSPKESNNYLQQHQQQHQHQHSQNGFINSNQNNHLMQKLLKQRSLDDSPSEIQDFNPLKHNKNINNNEQYQSQPQNQQVRSSVQPFAQTHSSQPANQPSFRLSHSNHYSNKPGLQQSVPQLQGHVSYLNPKEHPEKSIEVAGNFSQSIQEDNQIIPHLNFEQALINNNNNNNNNRYNNYDANPYMNFNSSQSKQQQPQYLQQIKQEIMPINLNPPNPAHSTPKHTNHSQLFPNFNQLSNTQTKDDDQVHMHEYSTTKSPHQLFTSNHKSAQKNSNQLNYHSNQINNSNTNLNNNPTQQQQQQANHHNLHYDQQSELLPETQSVAAAGVHTPSQASTILAKMKIIQTPLPFQVALHSQQASETPRGGQSCSSQVHLNSQHFHDFVQVNNNTYNAYNPSLASSIETKREALNSELQSIPDPVSMAIANHSGRWPSQKQLQFINPHLHLQHQQQIQHAIIVGAVATSNSTPNTSASPAITTATNATPPTITGNPRLTWIAKKSNSLFKYEEVLEEQEEVIPDDEHKHKVNTSDIRSSPIRKSINASPLRNQSPDIDQLNNNDHIINNNTKQVEDENNNIQMNNQANPYQSENNNNNNENNYSHSKTITFERMRPVNIAEHEVPLQFETITSTRTIDDIIDERIKRNRADPMLSQGLHNKLGSMTPQSSASQQQLHSQIQLQQLQQQQYFNQFQQFISMYPNFFDPSLNPQQLNPMMMQQQHFNATINPPQFPFNQAYPMYPLGMVPSQEQNTNNQYPQNYQPPYIMAQHPYKINDYYHFSYLPPHFQQANMNHQQQLPQMSMQQPQQEQQQQQYEQNANQPQQQQQNQQQEGERMIEPDKFTDIEQFKVVRSANPSKRNANSSEAVKSEEQMNPVIQLEIPESQPQYQQKHSREQQSGQKEMSRSHLSNNSIDQQNSNVLSASFGAPSASTAQIPPGQLEAHENYPVDELTPDHILNSQEQRSLQNSMLQSPSQQPQIRSTKASDLKLRTTAEKLRIMNETAQEKKLRVAAKLEELRVKEEETAAESQIKRQNQLLRQQNEQLKQQNQLLKQQMSPTGSMSSLPNSLHQSHSQQQFFQNRDNIHESGMNNINSNNQQVLSPFMLASQESQVNSQVYYSPTSSPKNNGLNGGYNTQHIRAIDLSAALRLSNQPNIHHNSNYNEPRDFQQQQSNINVQVSNHSSSKPSQRQSSASFNQQQLHQNYSSSTDYLRQQHQQHGSSGVNGYRRNDMSSSSSSTKENSKASPSVNSRFGRSNEEQSSHSSLSSLKDSQQQQQQQQQLQQQPSTISTNRSDLGELSSKFHKLAANLSPPSSTSSHLQTGKATPTQTKQGYHARSQSNYLKADSHRQQLVESSNDHLSPSASSSSLLAVDNSNNTPISIISFDKKTVPASQPQQQYLLNKVKSSQSMHSKATGSQPTTSKKPVMLSLLKPGSVSAQSTSSLSVSNSRNASPFTSNNNSRNHSNSQRNHLSASPISGSDQNLNSAKSGASRNPNTSGVKKLEQSSSKITPNIHETQKDPVQQQQQKPEQQQQQGSQKPEPETMKAVNQATNSVFQSIENCYQDLRIAYDSKAPASSQVSNTNNNKKNYGNTNIRLNKSIKRA